MSNNNNSAGVWPFHGYAPGNYQNTCTICGKTMIADKLCFICLECAIKSAKSLPARETREGYHMVLGYEAGYTTASPSPTFPAGEKSPALEKEGEEAAVGVSYNHFRQLLRQYVVNFSILLLPEDNVRELYDAYDRQNFLSIQKLILLAIDSQPAPSAPSQGVEERAKEYAEKKWNEGFFTTKGWFIAYSIELAKILAGAADSEGRFADSDFTLWVVVNKWEYDHESHTWFNNYIGEFHGMNVRHDKLYRIFKKEPM